MRLVLLSLLVLIIALALGVIMLARDSSARVTSFPNGVRVELLGTAVGTATFTTEKLWQKFARQHLPTSMTRWIPVASSTTCSSSSNSVTAYFRVTDTSGAPVNTEPWAGYLAEDDIGFRFPREGGFCSSGSGASKIYGLILRAHPRRQPAFWFRFLDRDDSVIASLRVPNPVRGPFNQWQPQPVPQTCSNGLVTLQLSSLREAGSAKWRVVKPQYNLTSSDPAWTKAKVRYTTFQDATGNEGQRLSPSELAWKARALVFRERVGDFADNERLVITNLSIPAPGEFVSLDQTVELQAVRLTAHALAGPGQFRITNGVTRGMSPSVSAGYSTISDGKTRVESWGEALPFFLLEARDLQPDDELLVRLHDHRDREIEIGKTGGYYGTGRGRRMYQLTFTPPDDAKLLRLEIILNRPLPFEFMVNPADVRPVKP